MLSGAGPYHGRSGAGAAWKVKVSRTRAFVGAAGWTRVLYCGEGDFWSLTALINQPSQIPVFNMSIKGYGIDFPSTPLSNKASNNYQNHTRIISKVSFLFLTEPVDVSHRPRGLQIRLAFVSARNLIE